MVLRAKTDKRSVGAAGSRSRMRVRPQEECRYPMQLARPPARNNRDLRSDGPETSYKLLCLRAVRGNLLATSSAGPSLRRNSSRKKPLYRSFALSLRTLCSAASAVEGTSLWLSRGSLSSKEGLEHRPGGE